MHARPDSCVSRPRARVVVQPASCRIFDAGKDARWVSSPRSQEGVLTRVSRGCPHPKVCWMSSPKSACRKFDLLWSKLYQSNLAAPDEEVVVLHLPLRGHCTTAPGCRTSRLSVVPVGSVPLFGASLVKLFDVLIPDFVIEL